jgi:hypothetical protein
MYAIRPWIVYVPLEKEILSPELGGLPALFRGLNIPFSIASYDSAGLDGSPSIHWIVFSKSRPEAARGAMERIRKKGSETIVLSGLPPVLFWADLGADILLHSEWVFSISELARALCIPYNPFLGELSGLSFRNVHGHLYHSTGNSLDIPSWPASESGLCYCFQRPILGLSDEPIPLIFPEQGSLTYLWVETSFEALKTVLEISFGSALHSHKLLIQERGAPRGVYGIYGEDGVLEGFYTRTAYCALGIEKEVLTVPRFYSRGPSGKNKWASLWLEETLFCD